MAAIEQKLRRQHGYSEDDIDLFRRLCKFVSDHGMEGASLQQIKVNAHESWFIVLTPRD